MHRNNDASGVQPSGEVIVTIESLKHLRNTINGNAVWRVSTKEGAAYVTAPDSYAGLAIQNLVGKRVSLRLNYAGRIDRVVPA